MRNRMNTPFVLVAAVATLALVAAGCGGGGSNLAENVAEEAIERAGDGEVDIDLNEEGGEFSFEGEDGEGSFSVGGSGDVPDDFPSDFPLPDGDVQSGLRQEADGQVSVSVTVQVDGSVEDVASSLEADLADAGYEITNKYESSGNGSDNVTFLVTGDEFEGTVNVSSFEAGVTLVAAALSTVTE